MKILPRALLYALVIHIVYLLSMMFYGLMKTIMYTPDIDHAWNGTNSFQGGVTFGFILSPVYYVLSYLVVTVLLGVVLWVYQRKTKGY